MHESGKKKKKKKKKSLFLCFSPFHENSQPRVWAPYLIPRYLSNNLVFKMGDFHSPSIMEKWLLFNMDFLLHGRRVPLAYYDLIIEPKGKHC